MVLVIANEEISKYRNKVLGLPKKEFRALQQGREAHIPKELLKYKVFQEVKKDGN